MSTKRKTRASESAAETPESKRRKAVELESSEKTQKLGYDLLDLLKSARDKRNRLVGIEFETLPDKEDLPDYYDIIKLPIAFDTIEAKLKHLQYPTLTALESDLKRLVVNAKTYNEKDSEIHASAERIRKIIQTFMTQHNPAYNDPGYTAFPTPIPDEAKDDEGRTKQRGRRTRRRASTNMEEEINVTDTSNGSNIGRGKRRLTLNGPRSTNNAEQAESPPASPGSEASGTGFEGKTFQEAQEILLDDLLDFTNDEGVEISGPFANLPPRDLKDYYQVIKKPASLRSIQKKVRGQKGREKASGQSLFTSWQTLEDELSLIWNNARQYNEEGSEIYTAAGELEARFRKRLEQAKASVVEPAQPKVTLRVGAKEAEPPTKLKLHLSHKPGTTEGYSVDSEALKRQQDAVAAAANRETRATSGSAEDATPSEANRRSTPDVQTNGVKDEIVVSQSPPAPSGVRPTSITPGETVALATNNSVPPTTAVSAPAADGSPAPSQPRAPPPPPPRDPLEARLRPSGKGIADALISTFVLSTHPSLKHEQPLRLTVPPSEKLSQQSVTVTLPENQRLLRVHTTFPNHVFQRPHRIIMRLNREYLQYLPGRPDDSEGRSRTFDVNLAAGSVNVLDLEVLVALTPRGTPKVGTGSEYDYERTTVYLNVFS